MKNQPADNFFDSVDYVSIIDTIKGIYTSDGSMSTLLDFERVLDEADLYAFRNWDLGELVQGPDVKKYSVSCVFMWPYKLMPDPKGGKRLVSVGCKVKFAKSRIKVPVQIENYDDYVPGTRYPKMQEKPIWFVFIEIPNELLDEIREGSVDLAGQDIDLSELDDSYDDDLDKDDNMDEPGQQDQSMDQGGMGMPPPQGQMPPPAPV